jgi:hypothetical protein
MERTLRKLQDQVKVQIKVRSKEKVGWAHLAYIPRELKEEFERLFSWRGWTINDWLDKWAKEDFGIKRIETWDDLQTLRKAIRDYYGAKYPEILDDSEWDKHGWTRLWTLNHYKKEIENADLIKRRLHKGLM